MPQRAGRGTLALIVTEPPAMHVIRHGALPRTSTGGCHQQLVAGAGLGQAPVEVHLLSLDAGGHTHTAAHGEVRVVLVLAGSGKQRLGSDPQSFHAPCTLIVPAGVSHEIVNNGMLPLQLVAIGPRPVQP
jgi:uncharacterized RmlC-like cupin family protein